MPQWLAYIFFFISFLAFIGSVLLWLVSVASPQRANKLIRRNIFTKRIGAFFKMGVVVLVLFVVAGTIGANAAGPVVNLTSLKDNRSSTDSDSFVLSGDLADKAATLKVNQTPVTVEQSGHFTYKVTLSEGDNTFNFAAVNQKGDRKSDAQAIIHRTTKAEFEARAKAAEEKAKKLAEEAAAKDKANQSPSPSASATPSGAPEAPSKVLGSRTKTSGCRISGTLQDKACTPGAVFAGVTSAQVCVSGYSSSVRSVSDSTKNAVYAEYGISSHVTGEYEVDHLISLELGGSNDISNLWPEPANPTPGFHQKDTLENNLHSKICSGQISIGQAQIEIADNWLAVYNGTYVSSQASQPQAVAPAPAATPAPAQPVSGGGFVKLSTSMICHAPGDAYYDRTTNYTAYPSMDACVAAGGRPSLR